jgi:hypothetical protein
MFVYGKAGSKAPYSINVLTLFKLSETLENLFAKNLKTSNKNFFVRIEFVQKGSFFSVLFMDATNN